MGSVKQKSVMWRNFRFLYMTCGDISPHLSRHMDKFVNSPHLSCGDISDVSIDVENSEITWHVEKFHISPELRCGRNLKFTLFCWQICFVGIYAVLSQNLFCCDLSFDLENNLAKKYVCGEKWQISGIILSIFFLTISQLLNFIFSECYDQQLSDFDFLLHKFWSREGLYGILDHSKHIICSWKLSSLLRVLNRRGGWWGPLFITFFFGCLP